MDLEIYWIFGIFLGLVMLTLLGVWWIAVPDDVPKSLYRTLFGDSSINNTSYWWTPIVIIGVSVLISLFYGVLIIITFGWLIGYLIRKLIRK